MRPQNDQPYLQPSAYTRRATSFIDREFQLKYTRRILLMAIFITFLFLLPPFYLNYQNYSIFIDLADLNNPQMAHYLVRERLYLIVYFFIATSAQIVFWYIFSKGMSAKIVGPAKLLRNHIRIVSRGDFSTPMLQIRKDDEFKELISSYNYLYTLLGVQYQRELDDLKNIKQIITHPAAVMILNEMIEDRAMRLGRLEDIPDKMISPHHDDDSNDRRPRGAKPVTSRGSRHAS